MTPQVEPARHFCFQYAFENLCEGYFWLTTNDDTTDVLTQAVHLYF